MPDFNDFHALDIRIGTVTAAEILKKPENLQSNYG